MDHHDDWQQWPEEPAGSGGEPPADHLGDVGGVGDLGGHGLDDLGHDGVDPHAGADGGQFDRPDDVDRPDEFDASGVWGHPAQPGPDLLHEGGDEPTDAWPGPDPAPGPDDGPDHDGPDGGPDHDGPDGGPGPHEATGPQVHERLGGAADGSEPDQPAVTGPDQPAFADPDLTMEHDPGAAPDDFPPPLDLAHPPPVDGYPWSDPTALGDPTAQDDSAGGISHVERQLGVAGAAQPEDLLAYSATQPPAGADVWAALLGSDDPATGALARWWGPAG